MGVNLCNLPNVMKNRREFMFEDDFRWYVTAHEWTTVVSDSGTITAGDASKGVIVLYPSDGGIGDNDEAYLKSTNEIFLFGADKSIAVEALVQFTEANTDDANIIFGLINAVAADCLVNDGGGPKSSFSGMVFYKVDGGTVWRCKSSIGTSNTDSITTVTAGGSSYQCLRAEYRAVSSTTGEVVFFIDGQQCLDATTNLPIKHTITFASATEMQVVLGVKNGDTNAETLNCDYIAYAGTR